MKLYPSYLEVYRSGELEPRIAALEKLLDECTLCPRNCRVHRREGEEGVCKAGAGLKVSSAFPHFGEEPPLVGWGGSGTIFLTHCNLRCVFCQNFDISHEGKGEAVTAEEFADLMIRLQHMGCHNINFVTPTHYSAQIVSALPLAIESGLQLPIVWNCGGYESLEVIRLLDGIVDIYMPDIKYSEDLYSKKYSRAPGYFDVAKAALKEIYRQVGNLEVDARGIAKRGLLIRHLVMPGGVAGTEKVMKFIAEELSIECYVNIMDQYHPCYQAERFPEINRRITSEEYSEAITSAKSFGLHRGFQSIQ
ncbi:MAG: radical SAM protein [Proteobacteria bacterium]|nr:radical SAM protein [Pseudomonadota bacterium]